MASVVRSNPAELRSWIDKSAGSSGIEEQK